jgi:ABC-type glycerol-3-phosphate transport system permease component
MSPASTDHQLRVHRRIVLPMRAPTLLTVGVLNVLYCWNDVQRQIADGVTARSTKG